MFGILGIILLLTSSGFSLAFAYEQIPITFSGKMNEVQFDGKWSFDTEWKQSSLNNYHFNDGNTLVILRTAHQDKYVYIFVDMINDEVIDGGGDRAAVCFDTSNDKTAVPNDDDYCFDAILGSGQGNTYGGDGNDFQQIPNHSDFVGLSAPSDVNDRYSGVSHPGYEFRIPTDLIGRSHVYGFYFEVFDKDTNKLYTYPENNSTMQNPASWGEIYSPDRSLPEFDLPMIMLLPLLGLVIIITKKLQLKI